MYIWSSKVETSCLPVLLKRVTVTVIYILLKRNGNNDDRFLEISRPESKLKFVEEKVKRETDHLEKN